MIGKSILHYHILEKLGEGGMGVVYKAEDTKLERTVAIKFLPKHIASNDEERKRFEIEAKAAAALNHPNIATIHTIEEIAAPTEAGDDEMFIVMEYIEGQELRKMVGAENFQPPPVETILDYATQIAAGLQAAHGKGVVHRDIKSANVMVTDQGVIKIMDFGLAKLADRSK
ncbi:serine/threonine protein kinase, partial [bacterium]|nr:serine/threonine protein kinase [bacterium]